MSDSVRPHRRQPIRLRHPWDSPGKNTGVGCHFLLQCMKVKSEREVAQSCPTLHSPMDCSPPGSSVHGIFQARVMEWSAIAFSTKWLSLDILSICLVIHSEFLECKWLRLLKKTIWQHLPKWQKQMPFRLSHLSSDNVLHGYARPWLTLFRECAPWMCSPLAYSLLRMCSMDVLGLNQICIRLSTAAVWEI